MQLPESIRYLAIEGVLGVGKSTLVKYFGQHTHAQPLFESHVDNPFLTQFYENRSANAFQTQIVFLLSRYNQIKDTFLQQDLFIPQIISDYMFAKDRIFASINLNENEMAIYNKLSTLLQKDLIEPDYIVYLQASTEVLLERIAMRDRTFERNIDEQYIDSLNECYNSFFMHYEGCPVLIVNTNNLDFVKNPDDFQFLLNNICKVPPGKNFLSPVSP